MEFREFDLNIVPNEDMDELLHDKEYDHAEEGSEGDNLIHPAIGMEFFSSNDAFFYNKYAKRHGFGAVRRTNHNKDGVYYRYTFACNKHKKIIENISEISNIPERNHLILATEFKVKITIAYPFFANIWTITKVNLEHNHELIPNTSHRITTHRDIPLRFQKELETNDVQGIPPFKNIQMVIEHVGGYGKCTFTKRDMRNHIDKYLNFFTFLNSGVHIK
jgi:FAR1 DNA-binding domain